VVGTTSVNSGEYIIKVEVAYWSSMQLIKIISIQGKIGFLVYAQSGIFFDNLRITDLWAVHPQNKLAITWA